jgi:predicted nucleic acid-binding protein
MQTTDPIARDLSLKIKGKLGLLRKALPIGIAVQREGIPL